MWGKFPSCLPTPPSPRLQTPALTRISWNLAFLRSPVRERGGRTGEGEVGVRGGEWKAPTIAQSWVSRSKLQIVKLAGKLLHFLYFPCRHQLLFPGPLAGPWANTHNSIFKANKTLSCRGIGHLHFPVSPQALALLPGARRELANTWQWVRGNSLIVLLWDKKKLCSYFKVNVICQWWRW